MNKPKLIEYTGYQYIHNYKYRLGTFRCPYCNQVFEARTNDVKRKRVRHCGCNQYKSMLATLPKSTPGGFEIIKDLGTDKSIPSSHYNARRRRVIIQCPECSRRLTRPLTQAKKMKSKHCGCKGGRKLPKYDKQTRLKIYGSNKKPKPISLQ